MLPPKSSSCPMKTHVFINCVKPSNKKVPLDFSKVPRFLGKRVSCSLRQVLVLALSLKTCQNSGFFSQSSGPSLESPWPMQNHFWVFLDHESLPYLRKTHMFLKLFIFLTHLPPSVAMFAGLHPAQNIWF